MQFFSRSIALQGRSQTQNLGGGANICLENKISEVDFFHFYENW